MSLRSRAPALVPTRLGAASSRLSGSRRLLATGAADVRATESRLRLPEYLLNVPPTQVFIIHLPPHPPQHARYDFINGS